MASDSRYIYYAPQEVQPAHGYAQYAPYETPQYAPNPARPVRNGVPQATHPPPQQQAAYPPPPNGYAHPPAYVQTAYAGAAPHPPPPPHWPESWQHFPPSFAPAQIQESQPQQYASSGRPEVPPPSQSSGEQRAPPDSATTQASAPQGVEQPSPPGDALPPPKSRPTRETEPQPPAQAPPGYPLDYNKLQDSYRLILESANGFTSDTGQGRYAINSEGIERMLQAAMYGAQALDSAAKRAREAPPVPPPTEEQVPEGGDGSGGKPRQKNEPNPEGTGQTCLGCNATSTPEWRRGPLGPRTLCNACGLVYAKLIKKRTREPARSRAQKHGHSGHADGLSSGDDGSDHSSQGRHSEVPDDRQG